MSLSKYSVFVWLIIWPLVHVKDCLHIHFRKIASELWLLRQLIGPIGLLYKNACEQRSFFIFCRIFMKLADNNDMHKTSDELEKRSNNSRVTSPWLSKWSLLPCEQYSFFIFFFVGSSWNLQIIMTCIEFQMSLERGQIVRTMAELYSLDCQDCLWTQATFSA